MDRIMGTKQSNDGNSENSTDLSMMSLEVPMGMSFISVASTNSAEPFTP